jgi:hypothetical protein
MFAPVDFLDWRKKACRHSSLVAPFDAIPLRERLRAASRIRLLDLFDYLA